MIKFEKLLRVTSGLCSFLVDIFYGVFVEEYWFLKLYVTLFSKIFDILILQIFRERFINAIEIDFEKCRSYKILRKFY